MAPGAAVDERPYGLAAHRRGQLFRIAVCAAWILEVAVRVGRVFLAGGVRGYGGTPPPPRIVESWRRHGARGG